MFVADPEVTSTHEQEAGKPGEPPLQAQDFPKGPLSSHSGPSNSIWNWERLRKT